MQHRSTHRSTLGLGTVLLAALCSATACTGRPASNQVVDLSTGSPFVSVRKPLSATVRAPSDSLREPLVPGQNPVFISSAPRAPASDVVNGAEGNSDFYVGIKKSLLGERWFLSAYMKQFYPDNQALAGEQRFADAPLGTRVVSFKLQNGRLFVFDASDTQKQSALQDPSILLEAYPVVEQPEFSALPGSEEYVLFDPAQGLNDFSLNGGKTYADPYLGGARPVNIALSYLQNFHQLSDGAAFEQVFSGAASFDPASPPISAWGTLGVALRRYQVGAHFTSVRAPSTPFFLTTGRLVSESGGHWTEDAMHWDFYPGMQPVEVFIGGGALRAQADFPNVDVLGALRRGVESWNDVFGFPVFQATFVEDDEVRDDDASFVLVDYPGVGNDVCHGQTRVNPENGEIRAANVYLGAGAFVGLGLVGLQSLTPAPEGPAPAARQRAPLALNWAGMKGDASAFEEEPMPTPAALPMPAAGATPEERAAAWIQAFLGHEMGHTLGLRHNFKGSLVAPQSSIMDYADDLDTFSANSPGTYDVAAIRYLYGLSPDLPTQAFCTDEDTLSDPNCARWDSGAAPLYDYWAPIVQSRVDQVLDAQQPLASIDTAALSQLLNFARDNDSTGFTAAADRINALGSALGRTLVPLDPELLADAQKVAAANAIAELLLRRSVLEPSGDNTSALTDPAAIQFLSAQAGKMLRNEDGARSYALRRTAADVLRRLQSDAALLELRAAQQALRTGAASSEPTALDQDLLDRINALLTPYYD